MREGRVQEKQRVLRRAHTPTCRKARKKRSKTSDYGNIHRRIRRWGVQHGRERMVRRGWGEWEDGEVRRISTTTPLHNFWFLEIFRAISICRGTRESGRDEETKTPAVTHHTHTGGQSRGEAICISTTKSTASSPAAGKTLSTSDRGSTCPPALRWPPAPAQTCELAAATDPLPHPPRRRRPPRRHQRPRLRPSLGFVGRRTAFRPARLPSTSR